MTAFHLCRPTLSQQGYDKMPVRIFFPIMKIKTHDYRITKMSRDRKLAKSMIILLCFFFSLFMLKLKDRDVCLNGHEM